MQMIFNYLCQQRCDRIDIHKVVTLSPRIGVRSYDLGNRTIFKFFLGVTGHDQMSGHGNNINSPSVQTSLSSLNN